jgi:hypothetical protein
VNRIASLELIRLSEIARGLRISLDERKDSEVLGGKQKRLNRNVTILIEHAGTENVITCT